MKNLFTAVTLALFAFTASAQTAKPAAPAAASAPAPAAKPAAAAPAASGPTAQQSKMGMCNKEAGDLKGDERKAKMKECLSTKKASQTDKMKTCNADAKTKALKGDERKAFMKSCLSGSAPA